RRPGGLGRRRRRPPRRCAAGRAGAGGRAAGDAQRDRAPARETVDQPRPATGDRYSGDGAVADLVHLLRSVETLLIATPNITIDRTVRLPELRPGSVLRPSRALATAGGKGVNVARV